MHYGAPEVDWFDCNGERLAYCNIAVAAAYRGSTLREIPYSIRVLLENLLRSRAFADASVTSETDIAALLNWRSGQDIGVPLHVARVILPDSSGLPVLLDLAALREAVARRGGDATAVSPQVPVDLIVDHSLQVDVAGTADAVKRNMAREFERNAERYRFLHWAQQAFPSLRVFPPGSGIIHQINLEHLATVVTVRETEYGRLAFPDFVIGGDSHTPMVNALGVLGWGVGGLDAEAAILGEPYVFPVPKVIGVTLTGEPGPAVTTTDIALLVTQRLREFGVTGCIVEFIGPAAARFSVPQRATIANMAPEYGATCGYFPVDQHTLDYLRLTGRSERQIELVATYCRVNHLLRDDAAPPPQYNATLAIDLGDARTAVAGPRRPQDRLAITAVQQDFRTRLNLPASAGGFGLTSQAADKTGIIELEGARLPVGHGFLAIAAITSCTNTSNPEVMLAAGLVAKRAVEAGLRPPAFVKTSLAPGSQVVADYLRSTGLQTYLDQLGFQVIGFGCTTCGGKSGPLHPAVAAGIERDGLVAAAMLSGNRNFEGRIHRLVRANYIGSPPLVVLYALAGRIDIDLATEPVGTSSSGIPVYMRDLWPSAAEIEQYAMAVSPERFRAAYEENATVPEAWRALDAPGGPRFTWDRNSLYLVEPPFTERQADELPQVLSGARALAVFGDSLTTDHISPSGEIPPDVPAGRYLLDAGVAQRDFNTYVARRCNHEVMVRGTFANIRIRNALVPDTEGGVTRLFPDGRTVSIFDAATAYRAADTPVIVLAGKEYGTGSSRDWAAKGTALLGIRAVIAESFERIHRANLVGMGVVPLRFAPGEGWRQLGLTGAETFEIRNLLQGVLEGTPIQVRAEGERCIEFQVTAVILTAAERLVLQAGGILPRVLAHFLGASHAAPHRTPTTTRQETSA
ncbi:MAG: aconitate hydratase AcnA [Steroidobacteraceae bacterium]